MKGFNFEPDLVGLTDISYISFFWKINAFETTKHYLVDIFHNHFLKS